MKKIATLIVVVLVAGLSITALASEGKNVLPTEEPQTTSVTPEPQEIQPTFVCPNNNPNCTQNGACLNDGTCMNTPGTGQGNGLCDGSGQGNGQGNGNGNGRCRQ